MAITKINKGKPIVKYAPWVTNTLRIGIAVQPAPKGITKTKQKWVIANIAKSEDIKMRQAKPRANDAVLVDIRTKQLARQTDSARNVQ